jgi:hypothetical protein
MKEVATTVRAVAGGRGVDSDTIDVSLHCPWCGIVSRIASKFLHKTKIQSRQPGALQRYCVVVCQVRECNRAVFVVVDDPYASFFEIPEPYPGTVYPANEAQYAPDGVPAQIAEEFCEALECAWSGHYLGAALVGRRVLQAAARDILGGKRKDLQTEIADIPDERLNKALKDQARHVRQIGNDAAHVDPVDAEDVEHLLDFIEQVLDALYVGPAKVAKLDAKRAVLKAAKAAPLGSTAPAVPAGASSTPPTASAAPTAPSAPATAAPPTK